MPATADTLRLDISGMTCGGCVRSVRTVLENLPGVTVEEVSLDGPAVVHVEGGQTTRDDVRQAVEGVGFTATVREA
jgi:copper chaperone